MSGTCSSVAKRRSRPATPGGRARWYAAAGAFAGLALATKYPAVSALIAPAAAHLARWRLSRAGLADRRVLLTGLAWLAAFLGSSPYLVLDRWGALRDLTAEFEPGHLGADRLPGVWNDLWYLYSALPAAAGWPTYLLGLLGLVLASRRDRPRQLVFAAFPAVYLVFSDWMYGRVYAEPEKFGREIALYEEMFAGGRLLAEFDPCVLDCWLGRRGPTIRVVQIR